MWRAALKNQPPAVGCPTPRPCGDPADAGEAGISRGPTRRPITTMPGASSRRPPGHSEPTVNMATQRPRPAPEVGPGGAAPSQRPSLHVTSPAIGVSTRHSRSTGYRTAHPHLGGIQQTDPPARTQVGNHIGQSPQTGSRPRRGLPRLRLTRSGRWVRPAGWSGSVSRTRWGSAVRGRLGVGGGGRSSRSR
jgi:hypothetical protein